MHVTQTYLGSYGDGGLFVYYLYEDYSDEQQQLTDRLQNALDDLGADYMNEIELFRPNPRFAGNIASEVRAMPELWHTCRGQLPGFLVCYRPLVQIDFRHDEVVFFSIHNHSEDEALSVVNKIRSLTRENIRHSYQKIEPIKKRPGFLERVGEAVEVKPRFMGVAIDLKQLLHKR